MSIGSPYNIVVYVFPNSTIKQLVQEHQLQSDGCIIVESDTNDILNETSVIERDIALKIYHNVTVLGALNETFIVEYGTKLGEIKNLTAFFNPSFVLHNKNDTSRVVTSDTQVLSNALIVITEVFNQEIVKRRPSLMKRLRLQFEIWLSCQVVNMCGLRSSHKVTTHSLFQ